jgi:glycosyltransferase involved in cell wall biosynthesis
MRILLLSTDVETRNYYIILAVADALRGHSAVESVSLASHGDALPTFAAAGCDTFIAVGGAGHQDALLSRLCSAAQASALWTSEDPYEIAANVDLSRCFTCVFTNDEGSVADYGGRAAALAYAASPLFHDQSVRMDDADYHYDLCFVGTAWPNRVKALSEVLTAFGRTLRTRIALPRNEFLPAPALPFSDQDTDWRCSNVEFAKLSNASRVTLTLERDFTASVGGRSMALTPPPRMFETALAGGFQVIVTQQPWSGSYFAEGREVAVCRSGEEAIEAIRVALADPARRIASAVAARETAAKRHLYRHRVAEIVERLLESARRPPARSNPASPVDVLLVTHNLQGGRPGGGVEIYQEELRRMPGGYVFHYLVPGGTDKDPCYVLHKADGSVFEYRLPTSVHPNALTDAGAEAAFQVVLNDNSIRLVHFQHLMGYPLSLPIIAAACGVPTAFTVHDYFLVCKRFNLMDFSGRFCDIAAHSISNCDVCLNATDGLPAGSQARRAAFVARMIRSVGAVIASTTYSVDYLRRVYPEIPESAVSVVEMLVPKPASAARRRLPPDAALPLRVVVPGNFTEGKGAHQVVRIMNQMREDHITFTILGYIHPDFNAILQELNIPNVFLEGPYGARDAVYLMSSYDVSLHLSVWPETYMITLSEAWAAGLVPIASALGAPADRITHDSDGFLIDPLDVGGVIDLLKSLDADRSRLLRMASAVAAKPSRAPAAHLLELASIYAALLSRAAPPARDARQPRASSRQMTSWVAGVKTNSPFWDRADNTWDDAPSASVSLAKFASFADRLPDRVDMLPQVVLDGKDPRGARVHIDALIADGAEGDPAAVRAGRTLSIRGWAFAPGYGRLVSAFARLTFSDGGVRILEFPAVARPDVAIAMENPQASACGFSVLINLRSLASGECDLDIIQAYDATSVTFMGVADLSILGDRVFAPAHRASHDVDNNEAVGASE